MSSSRTVSPGTAAMPEDTHKLSLLNLPLRVQARIVRFLPTARDMVSASHVCHALQAAVIHSIGTLDPHHDHTDSLLHRAAATDRRLNTLAIRLLTSGANPDIFDLAGQTPLHVAAHRGSKTILSLLLRHGADANAAAGAPPGYRPLHFAARGRSVSCVRLLLEHGANVLARDRYGHRPVLLAIQSHNDDIFDALLPGAETSPGADGGGNDGALHLAAREDYAYAVEKLLQRPYDVHARTRQGLTPLHLAARTQARSAIRLLTSSGASLAARAANGRTPIHEVVATKRARRSAEAEEEAEEEEEREDWRRAWTLDALLEHLCRRRDERQELVNMVDARGWAPLHHACLAGTLPAVEGLLALGARPLVFSSSGWTPLHVAARAGRVRVLHALVRGGGGVDEKTAHGETSLQIAASRGWEDCVRELLRLGALPLVRDGFGQEIAVERDWISISRVVKSFGVVMDSGEGETPYAQTAREWSGESATLWGDEEEEEEDEEEEEEEEEYPIGSYMLAWPIDPLALVAAYEPIF